MISLDRHFLVTLNIMTLTQDMGSSPGACLVNGTIDETPCLINSCHFPTPSRPRRETDHLEAISLFNHEGKVSALGKVPQTPELMMVSWAVLLQAYTLNGSVSFVSLARKDVSDSEAEEDCVDNGTGASVCEYQVSAGAGPKIVHFRNQQPLTQATIVKFHINTAVRISASKSSGFQDEELLRLPFLQCEGFKYQVC